MISFEEAEKTYKQEVENKERKKLKMLCLHGINANKEAFNYQSKRFQEVFGKVMEFYVINAPHECPEKPIQFFLDKGFKPPFWSWTVVPSWLPEEERAKLPKDTFPISMESFKTITEEMKKNGPFDGVLSFSQGSMCFRYFYVMTQFVDPENLKLPCEMPKFVVSVGGPYFPAYKVSYKGESYSIKDYKIPIPSCHIEGEQDEYKDYLFEHDLYEDPLIIKHKEGHKFPNSLEDQQFENLKAFVRQQFYRKFHSEEEFDIDFENY